MLSDSECSERRWNGLRLPWPTARAVPTHSDIGMHWHAMSSWSVPGQYERGFLFTRDGMARLFTDVRLRIAEESGAFGRSSA